MQGEKRMGWGQKLVIVAVIAIVCIIFFIHNICASVLQT